MLKLPSCSPFLGPLFIVFFILFSVGAGFGATWSVVESGEELRIHYGSNGNFPQYAVLHRTDGYFRMIPGTLAGWGTSVILPPSFWSGCLNHRNRFAGQPPGEGG